MALGLKADVPGSEQDLGAEQIHGSAVAVSPQDLLTTCSLVPERRSVSLVRLDEDRTARITAAHYEPNICILTVAAPDLRAAPGFRTADDLQVGETVYALVSRSDADFTLSRGELLGKFGLGGAEQLEVSSRVPAGKQAGALLDADGNLIGIVTDGTTDRGTTLAVPIKVIYAPGLANKNAQTGDEPETPVPPPQREAVVLVYQHTQDQDEGGGQPSLPAVGAPAVPGTPPPAPDVGVVEAPAADATDIGPDGDTGRDVGPGDDLDGAGEDSDPGSDGDPGGGGQGGGGQGGGGQGGGGQGGGGQGGGGQGG